MGGFDKTGSQHLGKIWSHSSAFFQERCVQAGDMDLWQRVSQLMDHTEERKMRGEWNMFQLDVVEFLRGRCFLQNKISQVALSYNFNVEQL